MVLILGGTGAGKRELARSLGYADRSMSADVRADLPVVFDLQETVRHDPDRADALLPLLLKKELVLCCEVGCGVIPMEKTDRAFREATGRLLCALAREATAVVRVVAGIPVVLKGELPCVSD
jgi:adenosyl cobinamide kinase/adenosyl cobinamide phosphate guanylyltransferase